MSWILKYPFTITLFLVIFAVGIVTGPALGRELPSSIQERWAAGPQKVFEGKWWTIFTSVFLCNDAFTLYGGILAGAPIIAMAESRLGVGITVEVYWAIQAVAWLLIAIIFRFLMSRRIGPGPEVYTMTDIGFSGGLFGVAGVLLVALNRSPEIARAWQTIALEAGVPLYLILKWVLMPEWLADTVHWIALTLGLLLGFLL